MRTKVFAAYLPQYHETEDNNIFWGQGYTDWVGVKKAEPQYLGHKQPKVPLDSYYYDLTDYNVILWQSRIAKKYGIDGFNIYHYWFKDGKQELEKPAEILLEHKEINIEFFFTWDNASWKRTWGNVQGNDWAPVFDNNDNKGSSILVEFAKDDFFRLWFVVFAIYALSIMINLIVSNHQTSRVLATLNTLIISLVALQYYALFSRIEIDTKKIGQYALWNMLILLCFLGIYLFISNWKNITFFGYSLSAVDTIKGANGRFVGFFAYVNLVTLFSIVMLPFAIEYLNQKSKIYSFFVLVINLLFSYFARSRSGQLIILLIIALYTFDFLKLKIQKKSRRLFVAVTGLLICVIGLALWPVIYAKLQGVFLSRAESNSMRFMLYKKSFERMLVNNPLLGMGIKDLYQDTIYPYGSHSSYIGYFYKTGLIGGSIYLLAVCEFIKKMAKWRKKNFIRLYVFLLCNWTLFMDES